jgi:hypothetical protein
VVEVEERNENWKMELGSDYEELIALVNCIDSVDVHFFGTNFEPRSTLILGRREYVISNRVTMNQATIL